MRFPGGDGCGGDVAVGGDATVEAALNDSVHAATTWAEEARDSVGGEKRDIPTATDGIDCLDYAERKNYPGRYFPQRI